MAKRLEYAVIDHGVDGSQYFPGCGVAFTRYTDVATGIGESAREAGIDAFEGADIPTSVDASELIKDIAALPDEADAHEECDPADDGECELTHFVSIRWSVVESVEARP